MEEIEIELSDKDFLVLAKLAHEKDITFNQLVNNILKEAMEKESDTL
jgi:predicted DNA-binding ribbon-helix-helix protein